jgi:hypothetical protein
MHHAGTATPGVKLVIDVNGIHFKRLPLEDAQSISFEIRDPIILPGITNVFEIRIERDGKVVTDRSILEKIAITHFVIDDHHIPLPI